MSVLASAGPMPAVSIAMKRVLMTIHRVMKRSTKASIMKSSMSLANLYQPGEHSQPNNTWLHLDLRCSLNRPSWWERKPAKQTNCQGIGQHKTLKKHRQVKKVGFNLKENKINRIHIRSIHCESVTPR